MLPLRGARKRIAACWSNVVDLLSGPGLRRFAHGLDPFQMPMATPWSCWLVWAVISLCLQQFSADEERQPGEKLIYCSYKGPCEPCKSEEHLQKPVCNVTGYSQSILCSETQLPDFNYVQQLHNHTGDLPDARACRPMSNWFGGDGASSSEGMTVATFEVLMIGLLIIAMGVVLWRKKRLI